MTYLDICSSKFRYLKFSLVLMYRLRHNYRARLCLFWIIIVNIYMGMKINHFLRKGQELPKENN